MPKELHIDIGGGEQAEYFVSKAARDRNSDYIVLDPGRFHCPHPQLYKNLHLIRWGASEKGNWELPLIDTSVDEAHMNFLLDCIKWPGHGKAYSSIIESLRRVLKPNGIVYVREPAGEIDFTAKMFRERGFQPTDPSPLNDGDGTATSSYLMGWGAMDLDLLPMQFQATLKL